MTVLIFHLFLSLVNNMIKENALPVLMQLPIMSVMEYVFQLEIIMILNIKWLSYLQPPILNSLDVLKFKMMFVQPVLQVILEMILLHLKIVVSMVLDIYTKIIFVLSYPLLNVLPLILPLEFVLNVLLPQSPIQSIKLDVVNQENIWMKPLILVLLSLDSNPLSSPSKILVNKLLLKTMPTSNVLVVQTHNIREVIYVVIKKTPSTLELNVFSIL